jgi:hypothetical protein
MNEGYTPLKDFYPNSKVASLAAYATNKATNSEIQIQPLFSEYSHA